jgi:hypothetical protein
MIGGTLTATTHIIITTIAKFQLTKEENAYIDTSCVVKQMVANSLLYIAINFAGMYTKYLTDRGQRLAFIETHKAMEHKKESEKEYQKTQRLLDSSKYCNTTFDVFDTSCLLIYEREGEQGLFRTFPAFARGKWHNVKAT